MFGLFRKLFVKNKEKKIFRGMDEFFDFKASIEKDLINEFNSLLKPLEKKLLKLSEVVKNFNELKVPKEADPKLKSIVESRKTNFCNDLIKILKNIKNLDVESLPDILKVYGNLTNSFSEIKKLLDKNGGILSEVFNREFSYLNKSFFLVIKVFSPISEFLNSKKLLIDKFLFVKDKFSEYENLQKLRKSLEDDIKLLVEEKNNIEGKIENAEENLNSIKNSEEYKEAIKAKEEYQNIKEELKRIKLKLRNVFSDIKKVIQKFKPKEKSELLEAYLSEPYDGLLKDDTFWIIEFLRELKNNLNKLSLDERVYRKTNKVLEKILNTNFLNITKKEIVKLKDKMKELSNSFVFIENFKQAENEYLMLKEKIKFENKKIDNTQKQLNKIEDKIKELRESIFSSIESLGYSIKNI